MNNLTENTQCLACGSQKLKPSLNLGSQPLANSLPETPTEQEVYPLMVNLCTDCYHLQLTHTVNPEIIYKNYLYASGTSNTLKKYSEWFAGFVEERITNTTNSVLDIGCNDGTQLEYFGKRGFFTYGIDPAQNLVHNNKHVGICSFFGPHLIGNLWENVEFDAITAQNVFAHNPNPLEFLETCKEIMSHHTLLFIQTSQADMVLNNEFDTIYHEHVNFFNINSMNKIATRAGLLIVDVIKTPIHGNSYVFVLSKSEGKPYHITNLISMEDKLLKEETYTKWEENVKTNTKELKSCIQDYKNKGYKIIGYGAAAKGNTLLNYLGEPLDVIIDDSPLKQGRYTPGLNIPITSIDKLKEYMQDDKILFIPLAWNFFKEISQRIKNVRDNPNDKFLKYFPKVEVNV